MSKKQAKKAFRNFLFLLVFLFLSDSVFSQHWIGDSCYTRANNKKIPLFKTLPYLKKELLVYRDIEYPDTLIFLYGYDCKISKLDKFTITPQLLFFIDTATKETVKQELHVHVEYGAEYGNISEGDLKRILLFIKNNNLPFLLPPQNPIAGSSYKDTSPCCSYDLNISTLKNKYPPNSWKQFDIIISIEKHDNRDK
jgi:hypothetical protein